MAAVEGEMVAFLVGVADGHQQRSKSRATAELVLTDDPVVVVDHVMAEPRPTASRRWPSASLLTQQRRKSDTRRIDA